VIGQHKCERQDKCEEFAPIRRTFLYCLSILVVSERGYIRFSVGFVRLSAGGFQIFWLISVDCCKWLFDSFYNRNPFLVLASYRADSRTRKLWNISNLKAFCNYLTWSKILGQNTKLD